MPSSFAGEIARVRRFVWNTLPLYGLVLAVGAYLAHPAYGPPFWALLAVLGMFAAADAYVLSRLSGMSRSLASGAIREDEARGIAVGVSRTLFVASGVLGAASLGLLALVAAS